AKQPRAQDRIRVGNVDVVKQIAHIHTDRQVVTAVGIGRHHSRSAPAEERAARPTSTAAPRATLLPLIASARLYPGPEAECLGETQVHDEVGGASAIVDGQGRAGGSE